MFCEQKPRPGAGYWCLLDAGHDGPHSDLTIQWNYAGQVCNLDGKPIDGHGGLYLDADGRFYNRQAETAWRARHPSLPITGKTVFGITAWKIPGRPGTHLIWGGPRDSLQLCKGGDHAGLANVGHNAGCVSEPCRTLTDAQQAVDAWWAASQGDEHDDHDD